MTRTIWLDMDGTICDLYGITGWLHMLRAYDTTPYEQAEPLVRLSTLAYMLNKLQKQGYKIGIISWLSKCENADYDERVTAAKRKWLKTHLKSVNFDEIHIVPYGTPKFNYCNDKFDILFDDEEQNRISWTGKAYDVDNIIEVLKGLK